MIVNFHSIPPITETLHGGEGETTFLPYEDALRRIIPCRIAPGSSVGLHTHQDSDEICYVLHGVGVAVCDGAEENLSIDVCHICPKGASHMIRNTGGTDLVLLSIITKR